MEEFIKIIDRITGLIVGLLILYVFLSAILKVDQTSYMSLVRDVVTASFTSAVR